MNIDTNDRREQRKFGLVMAAAFAVLGCIRFGFRWWRSGAMPALPTYVWCIAAAFLILGLAAPSLLRPVLVVWMRFALGVNWVMTRVMLTLAFFLLILPTRVILWVVGNDPLKRAWLPKAATYWEAPDEQPEDVDRYKNQF